MCFMNGQQGITHLVLLPLILRDVSRQNLEGEKKKGIKKKKKSKYIHAIRLNFFKKEKRKKKQLSMQ